MKGLGKERFIAEMMDCANHLGLIWSARGESAKAQTFLLEASDSKSCPKFAIPWDRSRVLVGKVPLKQRYLLPPKEEGNGARRLGKLLIILL